MNAKTLIKLATSLAVLTSVGLMPAYADITMTITAGANTVSVSDGGVGSVTYSGPVGTFWDINVDTAISKPSIGGPFDPRLDVLVLAVSSTASSGLPVPLTITVVSDGFGPLGFSSAPASLHAGGTLTQGSVEVSGQVAGSPLLSLGPFTTQSWSGSATGSAGGLDAPFSIGETITVIHPGTGTSSGDFSLSVVPEPSTLLAAALLLLPFGASVLRCLPNRRRLV